MHPRDLPKDWPHLADARRVRSGPHDWWVIETGQTGGPCILMLHGLGASGHSFCRMIAGLAQDYRLIVPDLPGQGCTRAGQSNRLGLQPIAEDLWRLCADLNARPDVVIGHSAGAAIALQMALTGPVRAVVGVNAALGTFGGAAGVLFPAIARGLAALPFAATAFARLWGNPSAVNRLLDGTGSLLDAPGRAQYLHLVRDPDHVAGALGMMAQWRLDPLMLALPGLQTPCLLIAGQADRAVPPDVSRQAASRLPQAQVVEIPGGHLCHEVAEDGLSGLIANWLQPPTGTPKII